MWNSKNSTPRYESTEAVMKRYYEQYPDFFSNKLVDSRGSNPSTVPQKYFNDLANAAFQEFRDKKCCWFIDKIMRVHKENEKQGFFVLEYYAMNYALDHILSGEVDSLPRYTGEYVPDNNNCIPWEKSYTVSVIPSKEFLSNVENCKNRLTDTNAAAPASGLHQQTAEQAGNWSMDITKRETESNYQEVENEQKRILEEAKTKAEDEKNRIIDEAKKKAEDEKNRIIEEANKEAGRIQQEAENEKNRIIRCAREDAENLLAQSRDSFIAQGSQVSKEETYTHTRDLIIQKIVEMQGDVRNNAQKTVDQLNQCLNTFRYDFALLSKESQHKLFVAKYEGLAVLYSDIYEYVQKIEIKTQRSSGPADDAAEQDGRRPQEKSVQDAPIQPYDVVYRSMIRVLKRLEEEMTSLGLTFIRPKSGERYNETQHIAVDEDRPSGQYISRCVSPGILFNGEVLIRAGVTLAQDKN